MTGLGGNKLGFVVIGRNEGERLAACLASLPRDGAPIVYVDSGSTDGSPATAEMLGAALVNLDMRSPFTAARARNAGYRRLKEIEPGLDYVQFIDGDCELVGGWIKAARVFLATHSDVAVVCGRRRERFPEQSLFNRLCDAEWATPVGDAKSCGGDALMRVSAFEEAGLYRDELIAGEEPELCLRLREKGWRIFRLDHEMTRHDAAIFSFRQWWRRAARGGHAFAEVSHLHRGSPCRIWTKETIRALAWSSLAPAALIGAAFHPAALVLLLVYPAQYLRLLAKERGRGADAPAFALLSIVGKFAESAGVLSYHLSRFAGRTPRLIEYKA